MGNYGKRTDAEERMSHNVVGISAYYHDSACALLQDGQIVAAAQEERFTRIKHDAGTPRRAFRYCLDEARLTLSDIDCLAYYEDPVKKASRQLSMLMTPGISERQRDRVLQRVAMPHPIETLRRELGYQGRIEIVDHHQAHAASSYYFSGFDEAAILTVDGVGEWATTTYGYGRAGALQVLEQVEFPHSLGLLYSALTAYLGFEVNEGEYKVMGLAPYGKPRYVDHIHKLIDVGPRGAYTLKVEYFDFLRTNRMFSDEFTTVFGRPPRMPESELETFHEDVACSMQAVLEEVLTAKVKYLHGIAPTENLCMAGGVALNCVANARILRDGPFKRLFVQPAATDAGSALGAAALAHLRSSAKPLANTALAHVFLGPSFNDEHIDTLLAASHAKYANFRGHRNEMMREVAGRLARGQIVGWFQGRMEFGPRALGGRSILADPRDATMRDRINALVKQREAFRPFAPVVLEHRAAEYFELDHPSRFMLETCQVRSSLQRLPAVTHVDGSARVQTVDRESNGALAQLLEAFDLLTGCPVLLNTSFNMRGEPIVCTPEDALLCFVRAKLDALVLGNIVIDKGAIPAGWEMFTGHLRGATRTGVGHDVYTFL
jgi:carbamoyltransferase